MSVYVHARNAGLELPLDIRQEDLARGGSLRGTLGGRQRVYRRILSGIDFRAEEGDRIGLLGLNGAGKTTLLRLLNGAFPPSSGRVERTGVTHSLLNPMLGFDEQASVVENVFLRGTAMGLRQRQLRHALEDILAFAGLEAKAGHPLHTLSSGQRMRLGFAITTAVQPDILLMDEWLTTGDAAFLDRAQQRMRSRFQGSRIVFLASHSPAFVRILCNKAIVLDDGRMRCFGPVEDALDNYRDVVSRASAEMRAQLAGLDPLLFGDCTGIVERIRTAGPLVEIQGWAVSDKGGEVGVVAVQIDGQQQVFETFERVDRADVRRHIGRDKGSYGFKVIARRTSRDPSEFVARRISVCAGLSGARLGAPLPIAQAALVESVGA